MGKKKKGKHLPDLAAGGLYYDNPAKKPIGGFASDSEEFQNAQLPKIKGGNNVNAQSVADPYIINGTMGLSMHSKPMKLHKNAFNSSKYGNHNQSQSPVSKTFFPKDPKNKVPLIQKKPGGLPNMGKNKKSNLYVSPYSKNQNPVKKHGQTFMG